MTTITAALGECLQPEIAARAQFLADRMTMDGARNAATHLHRQFVERGKA